MNVDSTVDDDSPLGIVSASERVGIYTPPIDREEGSFYASLTFRSDLVEARLFDSRGECREFAALRYDLSTGAPFYFSQIHSSAPLLRQFLVYSWSDIRRVRDLHVQQALPALEMLIFHSERLREIPCREDCN